MSSAKKQREYLMERLQTESTLTPHDYPKLDKLQHIKPSQLEGEIAKASKTISTIKYKRSIKYDMQDIAGYKYFNESFERYNQAISQHKDFISKLKNKFAPPAYEPPPPYSDVMKNIRTNQYST